jgi:hypothetical protein
LLAARLAPLCLIPIGLLITGCPQPIQSADPGLSMASAADRPNNDSFDEAVPADTSNQSRLVISGTIDFSADLDVYALTNLFAGDELIIDLQRTSGNLDGVLTLYSPDQTLHAFNDDRDTVNDDRNPRMSVTLRGLDGTYFLAVGGFPTLNTVGGYDITVDITRGNGAPSAEPAIVFLNWAGGLLDSPAFPRQTIAPFSAEDVGFRAAQTEALKDLVQQIVADRYSKFNLTVLNSDDHAIPAAPHSTIFFGGTNPRAFGLAEQIDIQNRDPSDVAVIFSSTFDGAFSRSPTLTEMATAIGNTTAHEIGHLLGLVHTRDCASLMDGTCSNNALLATQTFREAPLDGNTFPLGAQNADQWLGWLLGLR